MMSATCLSYLIILYAIVIVHRRVNLVWAVLSERIKDIASNLKPSAIKRLAEIHNYTYVERILEATADKPLKSKNYIIKYCLVTSFLIIAPLLFLVTFSEIYFTQISTAIYFRKDFIEIPINRRICAIKLCYNTMEKLTKDYSLIDQCGGFTNHASVQKEFFIVIDELKRLRDRFYEDKIYKNLPSESWEIIFAKIDKDAYFTQHGISSALAYLKFEALNYGLNPKIYSFKDLKMFFEECVEMSTCSTLIIEKNNAITAAIVKEKFDGFTAFLLIFILLCAFIPIFIIIPFVKRDTKTLETIEEILKNFSGIEKGRKIAI